MAKKRARKDKSLEAYREKRDFARTPEPPPDAPAPAGRAVYVVHRHDASRLHYDLRLEMEGVLRSWAVPKGFSYDPDDKHLAVRTEDHPLSYETFDGVIPKGEYGAGSMTIWDRGRYEVVHAPSGPDAVRAGELKVVLFGRRLRGEWHLVRTKQGEDTWLLFKSRDRYAGKAKTSALGVELDRAREAALARPAEPMRVGGERAAFSDPAWLFEADLEGLRVACEKRGDDVRVVAWADGRDIPGLDAIAAEVRRARATDALLDGVLVATDAHGRPSRARLDAALARGDADGLVLYAFDLLHFDDFDLAALPLVDRKGALRAVLAGGARALFVDHVLGQGERLLETIEAAGLPGMIAKRAASTFAPGASADWARVRARGGAAPQGDVASALRRTGGARRGARLKLSNLEKVYWPAEGFTKGDLIAYYDAIAPVLLPYLADRPVHMNRFPDGIEGKSFYQKDTKGEFPPWIQVEAVAHTTRDDEPTRYPVIDSRDALLFLINLGSIDMHPWLSRRGALESPDWAVIDLDPKGAPFAHVKRIARRTGELLHAVGLRPLLKTSGSTGLHVYVPLLERTYTYEHTKTFCEVVARIVARELAEIATVERVVGNREGKVYIDFLQNRRGQTLVPPYSVRPVRGATVSTPLAWDELTDALELGQHTILTVPARVAQKGDLFAPALTDRQDLLPALEALERLRRG